MCNGSIDFSDVVVVFSVKSLLFCLRTSATDVPTPAFRMMCLLFHSSIMLKCKFSRGLQKRSNSVLWGMDATARVLGGGSGGWMPTGFAGADVLACVQRTTDSFFSSGLCLNRGRTAKLCGTISK